MSLQHLPNTATVEEATDVLREHGHVIIDELVPPSVMDRLLEEMAPYIEESGYGEESFSGTKTRRTGCLIARSETARDLVMNPLTLGVAKSFLSHGWAVQLACTELISIEPGSPSQPLHIDDMVADNYPFPLDFPIYCNVIWAVTDFTEENGATRVVPGSHTKPFTDELFGEGPRQYAHEDTLPVEMARGSAVVYSGKLVHGGGTNASTEVRRGLSLPCTLGWIRQEENQFLVCPPEIARTLPEDLLRHMGYDSSPGYGHAGAQRDPLAVLERA